MKIERFDHIVLTVADVEASCRFYEAVLGMQIQTFREGRKAAHFGNQKINFHRVGQYTDNVAAKPTSGSADICLISTDSIAEWINHLEQHKVTVELGPLERSGAAGPILSIYFRDPDGNLIEVSNY